MTDNKDQAKTPILTKQSGDAILHQPGRKRRASGMTRLLGYMSVRRGNPQPTLIVSVMTLSKNPGIDKLRRTLSARILEIPRFRSRMTFEKKPVHWEEVEVDLGYHFEVFGFGKKVTHEELSEMIATSKNRPMDLKRPLWRIVHVPEMDDGTSKIVIAVNHCVGDGIALVNALLFKFVDEAAELAEQADALASIPKRSKKPDLPLRRQIGSYVWGIYAGHTGAFWPQDRQNPLKLVGGPGAEKAVARCSKKIELTKVKEVAQTVGKGVTVNDVIMATFTKTIALYFRDVAKEPVEKIKKMNTRVQFPVDVRRKRGTAAEFEDTSNNFGLTLFKLPMVDFEGTESLVLEIKQRIDIIKFSPQPLMAAKVPERILPVMPTTQAVDVAFNAANIATAMLSNVPGPQRQVHVAGETLENMEFFLFGAIGVYVGVFSYNGAITCTANVDTKIGVDPNDITRLFTVAFDEIYEGVCGSKKQAESAKMDAPAQAPVAEVSAQTAQ